MSSKYIKIYEQLCPNDLITIDDYRRDVIIAEMRAIHRAKTVEEAARIIEWWGWDYNVMDSRKWVRKARKLMGVK